nr:scoloptoxin SSD14 [Parasteatoda tepidariorum]
MFEGNATAAKIGPLSIAVPGELAGYVSVHDEFGKLPWEDLFPPTIKMCEEGITVNRHLARALRKYREKILDREHIRNVFANPETGDVYKEGDVYKRLDLAKTLRIISEEKRSALYGQSNITDTFLTDLEKAGSIITRKDLESYIPELREPTKIKLRGNLTLYSPSLPGSGALLSLMLNVLDGYDEFLPNITYSRNETILALHRIIETFKFAYASRMHLEDSDSPETKELIKMLMSKDYADEVRGKIDDYQTHEPDYYGVNITVQDDHGTAHLSLIAPNGDAVSVTSTVNQYFGSLIMSPNTGILLNDEMDDFSSPNITNYFGVPPTGKNQIKPGKRPMSSMTPVIIVDGDKNVKLAVGGNGGTQITTSVAQVILRYLWLNETIKEAIDAPRFHHQLLPNYIEHEENFPQDILDDMKKKGHELKKLGENMLGIIMAVARDESGQIFANSDYRKGGEVDGF